VIWAVVYLLTCCHNFQEPGHRIQLCCPCFDMKSALKSSIGKSSVVHSTIVYDMRAHCDLGH